MSYFFVGVEGKLCVVKFGYRFLIPFWFTPLEFWTCKTNIYHLELRLNFFYCRIWILHCYFSHTAVPPPQKKIIPCQYYPGCNILLLLRESKNNKGFSCTLTGLGWLTLNTNLINIFTKHTSLCTLTPAWTIRHLRWSSFLSTYTPNSLLLWHASDDTFCHDRLFSRVLVQSTVSVNVTIIQPCAAYSR